MVFEVDNTTKKLLSELQGTINETIESLKTEQSEIKGTTEKVLDSFKDVASGQEIQDIKNAVSDTNRKTTQQLNEVLANMENVLNIINVFSDDLVSNEKFLELTDLVETLKADIERICHYSAENKQEILKHISELILKISNIAEKIRSEIQADNKSTLQSLIEKSDYEQEKMYGLISEIMTRNELMELIDKVIDLVTSNYDVIISEYLISMQNVLNTIQNTQIDNKDILIEFSLKTNDSIETIMSGVTKISSLEKQNNVYMCSVVNYLSLPGYKRLFKGLEIQKDETAE